MDPIPVLDDHSRVVAFRESHPVAAQRRAKAAVEGLAAAQREYEAAEAELTRHVGPDPRVSLVESAIADFCASVTGRPSIPS